MNSATGYPGGGFFGYFDTMNALMLRQQILANARVVFPDISETELITGRETVEKEGDYAKTHYYAYITCPKESSGSFDVLARSESEERKGALFDLLELLERKTFAIMENVCAAKES
ncbi:uncharacterized protein AKAW2_31514A [Aspergillus luchuensis]|uniref:Uncharacterized protein n=1 Tax=Aspergillus kawachii TaxID=1069201 RepID=A0A7R7ZXK9_ASPKA|nr:uncharacterized protein AKAW2_31514A [Aspergillus luchuensis]BCR98195.1 hypothetical protein AKAW2_31514A [Aspergillus luchuensis]